MLFQLISSQAIQNCANQTLPDPSNQASEISSPPHTFWTHLTGTCQNISPYSRGDSRETFTVISPLKSDLIASALNCL